MKSSAMDELVLMLLWATDKLARPTLANLLASQESWEWRHRLPQQLRRMEQRKLLAREQRGIELVLRLTELGRLQALGGRDAPQQWARHWDGLWRQVLFDLPVNRGRIRVRLWRWLRENGFGYLQQSLWIHPHPVGELVSALDDFRDDVESFILMEARCCAGYANEAVVLGAWDFEEINRRHEAYRSTASLNARSVRDLLAAPAKLNGWLRSERVAWRYSLAADPLLPRVLWPKGYRGEQAWNTRMESLALLADHLTH
jgi:phenylacetic acid degradation operon negative regulatory protein